MATTREQAKVALYQRIEALKSTWTAFPLEVEYDNINTINLATQSHPFLQVKIVYQDGYQIDLSKTPGHRVLGTLVLAVRAKDGGGTKQSNDLLDHFYGAIHMSDTMPPLRTYAARFSSSPTMNGWVSQAALVPFWYDSLP